MAMEEVHKIEQHLKELFDEELWEAGVRLARAVAAEAEGYPEAAAALREVALDEAKHAYWVSQFIPQEEIKDIRFNIQAAIEADRYAYTSGRERAMTVKTKARVGKKLTELFEQLSRDEQAHAEKLEAVLKSLPPSASRVGTRSTPPEVAPP